MNRYVADFIGGLLFTVAFLGGTSMLKGCEADASPNPVTECRPPAEPGEKLVATLTKSADGGQSTLHCTYHATLRFAP